MYFLLLCRFFFPLFLSILSHSQPLPNTLTHTHIFLLFYLSSAVSKPYRYTFLHRIKPINDLIQSCNVQQLIFDQPAHLVINVFPIHLIMLLAMHELCEESTRTNNFERKKNIYRRQIIWETQTQHTTLISIIIL